MVNNLKAHIDSVKELYYKGASTDDRKFSDKFIAHLLNSARAILIRQQLDKGRALSENMYTTYVMDFEDKEFHGSQCASGTCVYKRSVYSIATPIMTKKGSAIEVLNLNGETLNSTSVTTNKYANKYALKGKNKQDVAWFIFGQYLWLLNAKYIKKLMVKSISSEKPSITESCAIGNNTTCVYAYSDVFIDAELESAMYAMVIQMMSTRTRIDKLNNNADDTDEISTAAARPETTN